MGTLVLIPIKMVADDEVHIAALAIEYNAIDLVILLDSHDSVFPPSDLNIGRWNLHAARESRLTFAFDRTPLLPDFAKCLRLLRPDRRGRGALALDTTDLTGRSVPSDEVESRSRSARRFYCNLAADIKLRSIDAGVRNVFPVGP